MPRPPERIRQHAHVAGNGELLWPRRQALEVAAWLAGNSLAIWGGEVFAPRGPFTAAMVSEWRTEPAWGPDEPWPAYVCRALDQARAAIERLPAGEQTGRPLYFLAYHSPAGFPRQQRNREGC